MEAIHHFNDCGNIILEIDKLVRRDRDQLHGNAWNRGPNGTSLIPHHAQKPGHGLKGPTPTEFSLSRDTPLNPLLHVGTSSSFNGSLSSLIGEPEPGVECAAPKDMRQVRLFKTRFCSYGSDCPYMLRGKCLYAHNRDEIRFRPPPPPSYKMPKQSTKSSPVTSPKADSPSKSVWALPENSPSENGDGSPPNRTGTSYSLFDFMPRRSSTTNINYSEFPSL